MYEINKHFMDMAIKEALIAKKKRENSIGAIIVKKGYVISKAHNMVKNLSDPTAHAEILAIRNACLNSNSRFLFCCDIYITLEPCLMCKHAISLAKIRKIYFITYNIKLGYINNKIDAKNDWVPEVYEKLSFS